MVYFETDYENLLIDMMKKSSIYRLRQLVLCLTNSFAISDKEALDAIYNAQRNGYLLISTDGWVISKGLYQSMFDDKLFDKLVPIAKERIPFDINDYCREYRKDYVASLWLVADFMPDSKDFSECSFPFTYSFIKEGKAANSLIEICYFAHEDAELMQEMLKIQPRIDSDSLKDRIRRIAIVEDKNDAIYVPYLGFSHIVKIDERRKDGVAVIEQRKKDERWA